jgi:hypothetical protein
VRGLAKHVQGIEFNTYTIKKKTKNHLLFYIVLVKYSMYTVSSVSDFPNSGKKELESIHAILRSEVRNIKDYDQLKILTCSMSCI